MKTEDFERLKKLCDDNGFELVTESPKDNDKFFVVKKKDEWEGVEFVYNLVKKKNQKVCGRNSVGLEISEGGTLSYRNAQESTEQAYVEQLKKEVFERFGEIKEGDRFKFNYTEQTCQIGFTDFDYYKHIDRLQAFGAIIYEKGKWAERVKERISIRWEECDGNYIKFSYSGNRNLIPRMKELAELLEKYLNNEIE